MNNVFSKIKSTTPEFYLLILSFLGILVSAYLWISYAAPNPIICFTDCELIRQSEYSNLFGISLPVYGTFFYLAIFIYILVLKLREKKFLKYEFEKTLFFLAALFGFGFSAYLTFIEFFVLHAVCQWCLVSAVLSTLVFFTSIQRISSK